MESVDNQQKAEIVISYFYIDQCGVEVEIGQGSVMKIVQDSQPSLPTISI